MHRLWKRHYSSLQAVQTAEPSPVRFYVSLLLFLLFLLFLALLLRLLLRRRAVSSEPRPSALCVPCWTSTAIVCALCFLPDLNCDHLRSVFPAGPEPRPSALSVPCRTSTATLCGQCSLPDLNRDHLRSVFPAGPQPRPSARSVPCRTSTAR